MQRILRIILIMATWSFIATVHSFAGPYEDGIEAAKRGDYETALKTFRSLADDGDPQGQTGLGRMYQEGQGVPQDYAEAANWYRRAAEQGNAEGQYNLAVLYRTGQGVAKDFAEAMKWYEKAAEQGHAEAINWLGLSIGAEYLGEIKTFDCRQIKKELAALAERYEYESTPRMTDGATFFGGNIGYIIAIKELFDIANGKSCESRSFDCSELPRTCDALIREGFDAFQSGDFEVALREIRPLAEHGVSPAQFALGVMYQFGDGVETDHAVAVEWYRRAADQGHPTAQRNLGNMYFNGQGVLQDVDKAIDWYEKAAAQGNISAQFNIGYVYASVKEEYVAAREWWLKSANGGYPPAMSNLGVLYRDGLGTAQDTIQAYMWFYLAAELGDRQAEHWQDELASSMTDDQIAEAENRAREWKEKI